MRINFAQNEPIVNSFACSPEQANQPIETAATIAELGKAGEHLIKAEKGKANADIIAQIYEDAAGYSKHGERMRLCYSYLQLERYEIGEKWKARTTRCKQRHCPNCQRVEANMTARQVSKAITEIQYEQPRMRWLFVTLTVRNCALIDLRSTIGQMNHGFKRMMLLKELAIVEGFARSVEVTRSESGEAHPHVHLLIAVPEMYFRGGKYISQARWTELWRESARLDYQPIVHVQAVKKDKTDGAVRETIKAASYSVKADDLVDDPDWLIAFHVQVKGLRFFSTGGIIAKAMKAATVEEMDEDEFDEAAEPKDPVQKILFDWVRARKRYER
jgi:plasmid rolling circle replication initiator protein Rep